MSRRLGPIAVGVITAGMIAASTACTSREPRTPDEARVRGDSLLREMSDTLARAQAFSFETTETHERVRRNGQKVSVPFKRRVAVRRPDRLTFHQTGAEHDFTVWYDGHALTIVGNRQRVVARASVPSTLDAMLDRVSDRFDVPLPMADVLYASPYDALIGDGSTGGWVRRTQIDVRSCEQVSYQHKAVDFTLSVSATPPVVPCQLDITYKETPGQPTSHLTFTRWNLTAPADEAQFIAAVPADYEEIPIVERIPRTELERKTTTGGTPVKR